MNFSWGFAEEYLEWRNDPSTRQWGRIGKEISENEHLNWLSENQSRLFSLTAKEELGTAFLKMNKERTEGEFSIVIAPHHRGAGVGEALLRELIAQAFKSTVKRIYGQTHEDNPALNLFLKVGFKEYRKEEGWVWLEIFPTSKDS